jgi:enoyl-CoA hydratase/carnithine racemase
MTDSPVLLDQRPDGIAVITFNRPEKRNAMNAAAREALLAALEACRGTARVVVLRGSGPAFCAGIDLKEASAAAAEAGDSTASWRAVNTVWNAVQDAIRTHPAIVIASVHGFALGGGSTLVNVADLAVAASDAQIGMPEIGFGSYPGISGPAMQLRVSPKRAAYLVLTAERIDGTTAEQWGLVNKAVAPADLEAETLALAERVAQMDPVTLEWSKRALWQIPGRTSDWAAAVEFGDYTNAQIQLASDVRDTALDAFREGGATTPGQGGAR